MYVLNFPLGGGQGSQFVCLATPGPVGVMCGRRRAVHAICVMCAKGLSRQWMRCRQWLSVSLLIKEVLCNIWTYNAKVGTPKHDV